MVGERGSTNLEILRTGSGKICRRWLKGVGEMKEICVVSKRGIGMKKKFEFILKFQRVSFFLVYIWKFETLEDWKMIKKKCINSTIWKIWKVLRKLKKLQKERNLKISRILRLRKFKNVCNHIRISTSSPIFTRNNPSIPIEGNSNRSFFFFGIYFWKFETLEDGRREVYKFERFGRFGRNLKVKKIAKEKKFENFTNFNILANRHKKQCFNSNRE